MDALRETLSSIDPGVVKAQIGEYVPTDVQQILASAGIRDEHVFPIPAVLQARPALVGYYRLLVGIGGKPYSDAGMGTYIRAETRGVFTKRGLKKLSQYCHAMCETLSILVRQMSPTITQRDVRELPLLTLGAQFVSSQ